MPQHGAVAAIGACAHQCRDAHQQHKQGKVAHHMQPELWKASMASQQGQASASVQSGSPAHDAKADMRDPHPGSASRGPECRDAVSARAATQRARMTAAMRKTRAIISPWLPLASATLRLGCGKRAVRIRCLDA